MMEDEESLKVKRFKPSKFTNEYNLNRDSQMYQTGSPIGTSVNELAQNVDIDRGTVNDILKEREEDYLPRSPKEPVRLSESGYQHQFEVANNLGKKPYIEIKINEPPLEAIIHSEYSGDSKKYTDAKERYQKLFEREIKWFYDRISQGDGNPKHFELRLIVHADETKVKKKEERTKALWTEL
jgi:DNA-binding Lrp family transcriptional regulator